MSIFLDKKCFECLQKCKKTPYGSCVILCKKNIRLCMDCYFDLKNFEALKRKNNLLKYLKKREIGNKF